MQPASLESRVVGSPVPECEICVVVDEFDIDFVACFLHSLTSARLSGLARRFDGSTLLTVMVGVTVFAFRSSCAIFSFMFAALTSLVVSCVPPTMNISSMVSTMGQRFQAHNPRILCLPQYVYTSSLHYYKSRRVGGFTTRPDLVRVTPVDCAVVGRDDDGGVVLWLGVAGGSSASSGVVDVGVGSSR